MTIYVVLDMGGRFVKAFLDEGKARRYVLAQPGKFNNYDVEEHEVED